MLQINFDPFPTLITERLILRQKTLNDAPEMLFLRSDEEVMKYIDRPRAKNIQDAEAFIEKVNAATKNNDGVTWAVTYKGDDTLIGSIGLWNIQHENYRAELGYVLHPVWHRKNIMSEAVAAVIGYGFNVLHLHSIEANILPGNVASAGLLEKAGFVQEAYFKENCFFEGVFRDSIIYSLLAPR